MLPAVQELAHCLNHRVVWVSTNHDQSIIIKSSSMNHDQSIIIKSSSNHQLSIIMTGMLYMNRIGVLIAYIRCLQRLGMMACPGHEVSRHIPHLSMYFHQETGCIISGNFKAQAAPHKEELIPCTAAPHADLQQLLPGRLADLGASSLHGQNKSSVSPSVGIRVLLPRAHAGPMCVMATVTRWISSWDGAGIETLGLTDAQGGPVCTVGGQLMAVGGHNGGAAGGQPGGQEQPGRVCGRRAGCAGLHSAGSQHSFPRFH